MMSGTVAMTNTYDHRISGASPNTTFIVDGPRDEDHCRDVESSAEFLERLRQAGVTQKQIAEALGIAQPNAATLYTPGKNGKLRKLGWDEGAVLASAFKVEPVAGAAVAAESQPVSADLLAPLMAALLPLVPRSGAPERSAQALSEVLAYGLELLRKPGATRASDDALEVAARAAAVRFRDLSLQ